MGPVRSLAFRLARRLGYRGSALAAFAQFDLLWAWSLLDPTTARTVALAPSYRVVVAVAPLQVWGFVMAAVGILLGVQAWLAEDRAAWAAAIGIKLIWAVLLLAAWPVAREQTIRPAAVFLTLAVLVATLSRWPEPPRHQEP